MVSIQNEEIQQEECPACPEGTICETGDLLCINIPCTTSVVLLGLIQLNLGPVCLRVGSLGGLADVSDEEKTAQIQQQIFGILRNSIPDFTD